MFKPGVSPPLVIVRLHPLITFWLTVIPYNQPFLGIDYGLNTFQLKYMFTCGRFCKTVFRLTLTFRDWGFSYAPDVFAVRGTMKRISITCFLIVNLLFVYGRISEVLGCNWKAIQLGLSSCRLLAESIQNQLMDISCLL